MKSIIQQLWSKIARATLDDTGSAVAETAMMYAFLSLIMVGLLQTAVIVYVRSSMVDIASAGARYASFDDRSLDDGRQHAMAQIHKRVPNSGRVHIETASNSLGDGGGEMITFSVEYAIPVLGGLPGPVSWTANGHAYAFAD